MCDLMIRDGEHFARAAIEYFCAEFILNSDPSLSLTEQTVEVDRCIDFGDAVFGEDYYGDPAFREKRNEIAHDVIFA